MHHTDIDGGTLQRDELEDLMEQHGGPLRLIGVDLSGADLSRMALDHWIFERCILIQTSFLGSRLEAPSGKAAAPASRSSKRPTCWKRSSTVAT